jgi:integrase
MKGICRKLLEVPPAATLKGVRNLAILGTLLYHGMRRDELCRLRVRDIQDRQNRSSIVTGFRIGLERSGRSRSITGGGSKSGGPGTWRAAWSRVCSSGVMSSQSVWAREEV